MRALLALVLSGIATTACAEPQTQPYTLGGLFREACIDTGMDRATIAALAARKGWQSLPFDAGQDGPSWGDGYLVDDYARVMLVGDDGSTPVDTPSESSLIPVVLPAQATCAVDFRDEPANWREDAEATARALNFPELELPTPSADAGVQRSWAQGREAMLTSRRDPSTGVVGLEIIRIAGSGAPPSRSTGE